MQNNFDDFAFMVFLALLSTFLILLVGFLEQNLFVHRIQHIIE